MDWKKVVIGRKKVFIDGKKVVTGRKEVVTGWKKLVMQARNQDFMWGGANEAKVDQTTEMFFLFNFFLMETTS